MFAFFMAALIPIPALRSFSLQVCVQILSGFVCPLCTNESDLKNHAFEFH